MENTINQSMISVVHDNSLVPHLYKYKSLYKNEDFVLIFYIREMYNRKTTLDRYTLETLITENAPNWLKKNSIAKKEDPENLSKDYLQSRSVDTLLTSEDEENVLIDLVLSRYDDLLQMEPILDEKSLELALATEYKGSVNRDILNGISSLMANPVRYKDKVYTKSEMVDYLRDKISDEDIALSSATLDSYQSELDNAYIEALESRSTCFQWNLGVDTVPTIKKSYMVSVIGFSKVGKTRFVIGEMVYPTLLRGGNVLILSGEMAKTDINSFIVIKHLYIKTGIRLGLENCNYILGISSLLKQKGLTFSSIMNNDIPKGMEMYKKIIDKVKVIPEEVIEAVILAASEVKGEKGFGIPYLLTKEDGIFNIKSFMKDTRSFIAEKKIDMLVIDHMGLVEPDYRLSKTETMTQAYQMAKQIAVDKVHPTAVIAINHIDTSTEEKALEGKDANIGMTARAFNTNEAKKSADLELVLYRTDASKREGQVMLSIPYSRWESSPTESIPLISDYLVSDFVVPGVEKGEYFK